MKRIYWVVLVLAFGGQSYAKSFGVVGEVFPVAELSFLKLIEERLAVLASRGEIDALNRQWLQIVAAHSNRPKPLGLPRAVEHYTHDHNPEIVLGQDIKDIKGRVLYPAGTHANALAKLPSYSPCWLFFNADDPAQMYWAQKQKTQCQNPKIILTGGAVLDAEKALNAMIYFDQEGRITQRLKIHSLPARVVRFGNKLRINEIVIKENGDVL